MLPTQNQIVNNVKHLNKILIKAMIQFLLCLRVEKNTDDQKYRYFFSLNSTPLGPANIVHDDWYHALPLSLVFRYSSHPTHVRNQYIAYGG